MRNFILGMTVLCAAFYQPSPAHALEYVICESDQDHLRKCSVRTHRDLREAHVWIDSQLSKSSCNEGYSWGVGSSEIWVKHGCRARFAVDFDRYRDGPPPHQGYNWDREDRYGYDRPSYDSYGGYGHEERELAHERERLEQEKHRLERERLDQERARLEAERRRLESHTARNASKAVCPPNAHPGRCSDSDRKHGCKDWRISDSLVCRSN